MPSDKALVRGYGESIAKSSKDITSGKAVFIDERGVAIGRGRYDRLVSRWRIGIYGALIGSGLLLFSGALLPGVLLYLGAISPLVATSYRGTAKLMAIELLARQGQLEEARRRLDAAPSLRRRNPVFYCSLAGTIDSHQGHHEAALRWWREAFPRSSGIRRELLKLKIASALLLSGRIEEARRELASVCLPPEADEVITGQSAMHVMFALLDPSAEPPSEDALHDRARRALEYSHTGVELAAIAWSFERLGNADMARWLVGEARERMTYRYLATWWPALQQWLDEQPDAAP